VPPPLFGGPQQEARGAGAGAGALPLPGMERMSSADEARASMQRARSAEATLSGMSLGAGGADAARQCGDRPASCFSPLLSARGCACLACKCGACLLRAAQHAAPAAFAVVGIQSMTLGVAVPL